MNRGRDKIITISNDEIDVGHLLLKVSIAIKRHFKVLLSFMILGLLFSLTYFFTKQPVYESSLIISSKVLSRQNTTNLLASLQELISDGNDELLASKLNSEVAIVQKISSIEVEEFGDNEVNSEGPVFLKIVVTVTDTDILSQLETGIINFLENNQFVHQRVAINRQRYTALLKKTQQEIKQIDSLKNKIGENLMIKSITPNVLMTEPVNIYTASLLLFEKKQEYIEQLKLINSIYLVKEFVAFQQPVSPKLMLCVITGLVTGLVLALIVIFFVETGVYLKKIKKENYL